MKGKNEERRRGIRIGWVNERTAKRTLENRK
jgi:hypothetical protein